jgi:sulfate/thiosulfate transport system substrate-binding protein
MPNRFVLLLLAPLFGCGSSSERAESSSLTLGGYTTPREAYSEILPAFQRSWKASSGRDVEFQESYLASGAQARAVIGGFEADVVALSLEPDVEKIREAGLLNDTWNDGPRAGIVTRSVVVIGVRPGNPKNIRDFADLARPGVEVLTPNVRTSGGAMWNVLAIYGATLRATNDREAATRAVADVLRNVRIMDQSGRDSLLTFERGVGDAIITYENEILVGRQKGETYEYVVPRSTISIENPIAVVDRYATEHGNTELARAFIDFVFTPEAQRIYANHGLRAVDEAVARETTDRFPPVTDLFTVRDLGGWAEVQRTVFAETAVYDRALELSQTAR